MSKRPHRAAPAKAEIAPETVLATQVLRDVLETGMPPAKVLERVFREERLRDERQRGWIAETVYGCLRHFRSLVAGLEVSSEQVGMKSRQMIALYLMRVGGWSASRAIDKGFADAKGVSERARQALAENPLSPAAQANVTDELWDKLVAAYGEEEATSLTRAFCQAPPTDIRVNTLRSNRELLMKTLNSHGHAFAEMPYSPWGLRKIDRGSIFQTDAFLQGWFEIQDEASQLVAALVDAKPKQRVLDLCAGAGGKTLALAAAMNNTGTLTACDVSVRRLEHLRQRLRRGGVDNVMVRPLNGLGDSFYKESKGKFDAVLIDAPCSGTGTLRRNPDIKWRPLDMASLNDMQQTLMDAAAMLVKPGGRLIYATCSLLPEENQQQVEAFLVRHPDYQRRPVGELLAELNIPLAGMEADLIMRPDRHGTDGFYAAVLVRNG